jgi:hypothetical protein
MTRESTETTHISRRKCLAGGVAAVTAAVAGCTEGAVNWLANRVLEEVNVLTQDGIEASGTVTVVDPEGETRLDEEFSAGVDGESDPTYEDVWTTTGTYEVTVQLDEPLFGTQEKSGTVEIEDTGNDRLFILLGDEDTDEEINFRVGEELTDVAPDEN